MNNFVQSTRASKIRKYAEEEKLRTVDFIIKYGHSSSKGKTGEAVKWDENRVSLSCKHIFLHIHNSEKIKGQFSIIKRK